MRIIRVYCVFILALLPLAVWAQSGLQPLNRMGNLELDSALNNPGTLVHTAYKPLLESEVPKVQRVKEQTPGFSWVRRKMWHEHLVIISEPDAEMPFRFTLDPVFRFEGGRDLEDSTDTFLRKNTRGFRLKGNLGEQIAFESSFYENQSFLPLYLRQFANESKVIPGQGRTKVFDETGFDYAMASGTISYSPNERLNFRFGHGKNFIGDGYRSLLLSDNAFNYPFLRSSFNFGKGRFQYTTLWSWLQSLERIPRNATPEASFERKAGTFHYLNWIPHPKLAIGLFEGVIWQRWDTAGTTDFDANFVNPLIGVNSLLHGLEDDKNNALLGVNLKFKATKRIQLYGQFMLDGGSEMGYQAGLRLFEPFQIRGFFLQLETNNVAQKAYNHDSELQNYSHYNQPLAHPVGSGFSEVLLIANYRRERWLVELHLSQASAVDEQRTLNQGRNIFFTDAEIDQTNPTEGIDILNYASFQVGYLVNPASNMHLALGIVNRQLDSKTSLPGDSSQYLYVTWSTALQNFYYDF